MRSMPSQPPRHKRRSVSRFSDQENAPPALDPNVQPQSPSLSRKSSLPKAKVPDAVCTSGGGVDGGGTTRPSVMAYDPSPVKVVVRIRPANSTEEEVNRIVRKIGPDSLSVESQKFTFDSVVGPGSTQEVVFQLVGAPLVKDSLAGYNTSILCYGETGSGKTYTMWGPLRSMLEDHSASSCQGIAPRIFHELFSEIQKVKESADGTQVNFQCRCSFLEIYNEQISDLLDPIQRNLQIRDDKKNGFYVENLTEDYVTKLDDVTQILVKGLSNRRVGATSVNSKSSRSHVVFTCIIESWCKGTTSKTFSSSKMSRISLVDLAGFERDIPDGASGRYKKEGKHIKKSLCKLGKLVNNLAEVKRSGEDQKISYSDSCLANLLRDSLGGNAKAAIICAVSPIHRCKSGTLSTLRFGQQSKYIENKAVMNEITEDYVNDLTDQIRQLKEELIREKTSGGMSVGAADGYFKRHNARGSLNLLRASLNRSLTLPKSEGNLEEVEDEVDEDNVEELCLQLNNLQSSLNGTVEDTSKNKVENVHNVILDSELHSNTSGIHVDDALPVCQDVSETANKDQANNSSCSLHLSIPPSQESLVFHEPILSTSPTISSNMKKSLAKPLGSPTVQNHDSNNQQLNSEQASLRSDCISSSLQSSKLSRTDSLAASLHRGLQIIDYHQRNSASKSTSVGFSFDYLKTTDKLDASMQTLPFLCSSCQQINSGVGTVQENPTVQAVAVGESGSPKDHEKKSQKAKKRALELEAICSEQEATIKQLSHQVEQYKQEIKQKSVVEQNQYMNVKEIIIEGDTSVEDEHKDKPVAFGDENSLKELELEGNHDTSFDVHQKNALLAEIQSLKSQMKLYSAASKNDSSRSDSYDMMVEEFEKERRGWTESESRWISLTEELRMDLETNRMLAEKKDIELASEKKCSAEMDDAIQRSILGHARMVEHFTELQEKYTHLLDQHRKVMDGIAEVKKAATKAGKKGAGYAFAQALSAELSTLRAEKEKERAFLKEQNRVLKIQLRDTAEAVHAAGELLVKLREAEETASVAEDKYVRSQQETEKLRKQMEKLKKKHAMEMVTVKHYMDESRLPECALEPIYRRKADRVEAEDTAPLSNYDNQSWRAAFEPSYR